MGAEDGLQRVEGAGADIAEHDAECAGDEDEQGVAAVRAGGGWCLCHAVPAIVGIVGRLGAIGPTVVIGHGNNAYSALRKVWGSPGCDGGKRRAQSLGHAAEIKVLWRAAVAQPRCAGTTGCSRRSRRRGSTCIPRFPG